MQTRKALRWPAVLLAVVLSVPAFDANAKSGSQFGPAVDSTCQAFNGTSPFKDSSCALCHNTSNLGQRQEPSWSWWANGDLVSFCPPNSNTPPVANNDSASTSEDAGITIDVLSNDSDADGDTLAVGSVTQGANGSVTNNGGNVRYTPNANFDGSDSFTYAANDGTTNSNLATVSVTVNPVNDQPVVTNPGDQASVEGQSVSLQIVAADPDTGDTLSYSASGLPTGISISAASGLISGTPVVGSSGNSPYTVVVAANDGGTPAGTDSVTFAWSVSATNTAPTITSTPVATATVAESYSYQVTADDEGPLSYTLGTAPSGMTISASSGLIQWTPSSSQVGTSIATVTVTDQGGLAASQSFSVEVQAAPVPPGPVVCTDADDDGFSPDGGICGPVDGDDDDPEINPGRSEVCDDGIDNDSDGDTDASDSECDGSNCLAGLFGVVNITTALWDPAASELQVRGTRCTSGSPIELRNAASGALLDKAVVDNIGSWVFNTFIDDATAVPCRVRVEVDGNSGESDVANAPANCDDGSGGGAAPKITKAQWNADKQRLRVKGRNAKSGQTVSVFDAITKASLGTTTVKTDGRWKFKRLKLTPVPCAVRVEIAGRSAERDVRNAPSNCSAADPVPVKVPDVVGQAQNDAESAIVSAGLKVGSVTKQASNTVATGKVVSQSPAGGTSVDPGSTVNLVVSTGPSPPPADFSIERAEWKAGDRELLVSGSGGPRGQGPAILFSVDGNVRLADAKVEDDGKWKFEVEELNLDPCVIRVEIGSSTATRAVSNAPSSCSTDDPAPSPADFSIDRAEWKAGDRKLLVSGRDGPRGQGRAKLFSALGSVKLKETKVEDDGKWKFEVEKASFAPCAVRVEIGSGSATRVVRNAPANCVQ